MEKNDKERITHALQEIERNCGQVKVEMKCTSPNPNPTYNGHIKIISYRLIQLCDEIYIAFVLQDCLTIIKSKVPTYQSVLK